MSSAVSETDLDIFDAVSARREFEVTLASTQLSLAGESFPNGKGFELSFVVSK